MAHRNNVIHHLPHPPVGPGSILRTVVYAYVFTHFEILSRRIGPLLWVNCHASSAYLLPPPRGGQEASPFSWAGEIIYAGRTENKLE